MIKLQVRGYSSRLGRFTLTPIVEAEYMAATGFPTQISDRYLLGWVHICWSGGDLKWRFVFALFDFGKGLVWALDFGASFTERPSKEVFFRAFVNNSRFQNGQTSGLFPGAKDPKRTAS